MKRSMGSLILLFPLLALAGGAGAEVRGEPVEYRQNGTILKGFYAYDDAVSGKRPGILVVHEWWGHNEFARERATKLAGMGYAALAVDMYGDGLQTEHPEDAARFSGELRKNISLAKARFKAGLDYLKSRPEVDGKKIGAIGYCFGGGIVLEMARLGLPLAGVASFHGSLAPVTAPAAKGKVNTPILVLTGAEDPMAGPDEVAKFRAEMAKAGADFKVVSYPGAKHSFTNPAADEYGKQLNLPLAYNAEADKKSWEEMSTFFTRIFSKK